jgi:hypothetical protein
VAATIANPRAGTTSGSQWQQDVRADGIAEHPPADVHGQVAAVVQLDPLEVGVSDIADRAVVQHLIDDDACSSRARHPNECGCGAPHRDLTDGTLGYWFRRSG